MPKAFSTLADDVEAILQDSSNALWTLTVVVNELERAIREFSEYEPHVPLLTLELETRTGLDTAGTTGSLTDTTESQFVAGDVDKVIFNKTENTWTTVTAFTSTSVLVLSRDIMNDGDSYVMYNQDCFDPRQLYLGDIEDYVGPNWGVQAVEFPIRGWPRRYRSFEIQNNILTILYDRSIPDSKSTENLQARIVDVNLWIARMHRVSRLTDLAGAVDLVAGYSRGDTLIHVDDLASAETIVADQEFTVAGLRGRYRLTADTVLASNEGDITFFPPLESALADNDVITFTPSTLNHSQERKVVDLAAGRAAISMGALLLQQANDAINQADLMNATVDTALATLDGVREKMNTINKAGPNVPGMGQAQAAQEAAVAQGYRSTSANYLALSERAREFTIWGRNRVDTALRDIRRGLLPKQRRRYSRM